MNWSDLKTRFWDIYGGDADTYPTVNDSLLSLANMSIRKFAAEAMAFTGRATVACTAGTQEYDLPSGCDRVLRAAYDNEKITSISKWTLQQGYADGWDRFQGTPTRYYVDGLNEKIGLYRIPSVDTAYEETDSSETIGVGYGAIIAPSGYGAVIANSGYGAVVVDYGGTTYDISANALSLFYAAYPDDLAYDTDEIPLPPWCHPYVLYDVLRRVYEMAYPSRDMERAAYWRAMADYGLQRLAVRSNSPTPKRHYFRGSAAGTSRGTWPSNYPEHIEESP